MIKSIIVLIAGASLATSAWTAENPSASRHENIGIGGGAVIGGAAGGPIGLMLGAALGAWLGDRYHAEHSARLQFEERWNDARAEVAELNGLVTTSERRAAALEAQLGHETRKMQAALSDALDVKVLFRTNESSLPEETRARLLRLAELLAGLDGTLIRIEGHADARGDQEHNEQLSARRAASVRNALIEAGVPTSRIAVDAHGETHATAAENDVDALALERRVDLTLIRSGDGNRIARK